MSQSDIDKILTQFRELSSDERGKGRLFERLIANYLVCDPQYSDLLEDVWLWEEWPDRWGADVGIDLVARERATGDYWAIQCKFFDPNHTIQKPDIDSFLSASGKQFATNDGSRQFARRILVSTTDKWNRNAESAIEGQTIPVSRISLADLSESPIDRTEFSLSRPDLIRLRPKKTPRPHQDEAIAAVIEGFQTEDRGKMIIKMVYSAPREFPLRSKPQETPKLPPAHTHDPNRRLPERRPPCPSSPMRRTNA